MKDPQPLVFYTKTDFNRYLPVANPAIFNIAAGVGDFKPVQMFDRFSRFGNGVFNRFIRAFSRTARLFAQVNKPVKQSHKDTATQHIAQCDRNQVMPDKTAYR